MTSDKLKHPLFLLRVSLFFVMLVGALIKLVHPDAIVSVLSYSSLVPMISGSFMMILGFIELLVLFMFLLGFQKKLSYGLVLIMNIMMLLSVLHVLLSLLNPSGFLFLLAFPMVAGSYLLYVLRDYDVMFVLE